MIIATKCGAPMGGNVNALGLSRHNIMQSVEASLARLRTHYIDLFYSHLWDEATPLQETLSTLNSLQEAGKVMNSAY